MYWPTVGGHSRAWPQRNTAFIQVRIWNYTTGSFEGVPFINQPDGPPDAVYPFTVDNTNGDYNDANGRVRGEVTFAKTTQGPIRGYIDNVFWTVN